MSTNTPKRVKLKTNQLIKNNIITKTIATFDVPEFQLENGDIFSLSDHSFLKFHAFKTYKESKEFFDTINSINETQNLGFNPPAVYCVVNKAGAFNNERMKFKSLKFLLELLMDKPINISNSDEKDVLNLFNDEMVVEYLTEIFKKMETVQRNLEETPISNELFLSIFETKKQVLYLIKKLDNDYKMIISNTEILESIKEFLINYRSIHNFNELNSKMDSFILNDFTRDEMAILETEYKYFIDYLKRFNFQVTDKKQEKEIVDYKINPILEAIDEFIIENSERISEQLKKHK